MNHYIPLSVCNTGTETGNNYSSRQTYPAMSLIRELVGRATASPGHVKIQLSSWQDLCDFESKITGKKYIQIKKLNVEISNL